MSKILVKQINSSVASTGAAIILDTTGKNVWTNQSTGAILLPVGTTAQEPSPASTGMLRYNTDTTYIEYYDGTKWKSEIYQSLISSEFIPGSVLLPGFSVTTDNTTGLYSPSTGIIGIVAGGKEVVQFNTATSAVNYLSLTPSATTINPTIGVSGTDTNIGLNLSTIGTGNVVVTNNTIQISSFTSAGIVHNDASGILTSSLITNSDITNSTISYSKIQNETAYTLLGNPTGSSASPSEITLGSNLTFTGNVLNVTGIESTLQLYHENPSTPLASTVTGANAIALGENQTASGQDSIVLGGASNISSGTYSSSLGMGANANLYGQLAHSNGNFSVAGDSQASQYVLRNTTNGAVTSELFLDGSGSRLVLPNNSAWVFKILIVARRSDAPGDYGGWEASGIIKRDGTVSSTAFSGNVIETILSRTNNQISINIEASSVRGSLTIMVSNSDATKSYNWVARVDTVEEIG